MENAPQVALVFGADAFLVEEEAEALLDRVAPDWRGNEFKVQKVPALADRVDDAIAALRAARAAAEQPGFFATDPVVWLRDLSFSQAPQSKDRTSDSPAVKAALDEFIDWLENPGPPPGTTLLVTSASIGKATRLFKAIDHLAKANPPRAAVVSCAGGTTDAAKKLLARKLRENGWTMSPETSAAFLDRVGTSGSAVVQELEKLFAYTGGKEPTPADIGEICTLAQGGVVWELQHAFGRRDLAGCRRLVENLLSGKRESDVVGMVIMLEQRLCELELAVGAREKNLLEADGRSWSRSLGPEDLSAVAALGKSDVFSKPSFQKIPVLEQAKRWNSQQIRRARMSLMETHERLTSASSAAVSPRVIFDLGLVKALC